MDLFNLEFRAHVWGNIEKVCKGGEGVTVARLTNLCGFSEDEETIVRLLVKREFEQKGMVDILPGKNGGIFMTGVERIRSHAASYEITDEYREKVRAKTIELLAMKPKGISTGALAGFLGELDDGKVRAALVHLPEFEVSKGAGVRRRTDKNPATAPAPAPDTTAATEQVAAQ